MNKDKENFVFGNGVQVVMPVPNHTFRLDEEALNALLLREDICDCPVVVLSVAGAFRKGKSFLLNFFLRYLHHKYNLKESGDQWLEEDDEPLTGFSWQCGSERHTSGIWVSQPFVTTLENNKKVAILLMDTQGLFDSDSTLRDNATVFATSMLLSSVQIYNLSHGIHEDDLQNLELIMNYGSLAQESSKETNKPFQHLKFLIRDWCCPYEYEYGADGGQKLVNKVLQGHKKHHQELIDVRHHIKACFEEVTCFLMPHPGRNVASNPKFRGNVADIDEEFKEYLKQLVPSLLAPQNLKPKVIDGRQVTVKELLLYFKSYMKIFNWSELPNPRTVLEATTKATNLAAMAEAQKGCHTKIKEEYTASTAYSNATLQKEIHSRAKYSILHYFIKSMKMGSEALDDVDGVQLKKALRESVPLACAQAATKVFVPYGNNNKDL